MIGSVIFQNDFFWHDLRFNMIFKNDYYLLMTISDHYEKNHCRFFMINGDDRLGIHRIRTSRSTRQSDEQKLRILPVTACPPMYRFQLFLVGS